MFLDIMIYRGREYNIEKAKILLKEAGYKEFKLRASDEPSRQQMAQIIQANLKEIGIDVEINVLEVSSFYNIQEWENMSMLIGLWYVSTGGC